MGRVTVCVKPLSLATEMWVLCPHRAPCVVDTGDLVSPLVGPLRAPSPPALSRWPHSLQNRLSALLAPRRERGELS